ncbi:RDD family protein [Planctomycetes bacterium Pan216]|uniref:RDD family protein n=1 Tax=Kolteria novifilia TaxID=2527975 RepID=A0A518B5J7_9BACT|nr:RDD family protein [Planctomycetes bacterium Pan216]
MTPEPLDTTIRIVTPENIAFRYRLAGPCRRGPAWMIDLVIQFLLIVGLNMAIGWLFQTRASGGIILVLVFVVIWSYGALFEIIMNGQTPGKRLLRLRVVSTAGLPINGQQAVLRNLLRYADFFPWLFFFPALVCFLVTRRFQRLGDLAADTMVIVDERHQLSQVRQVDHPGLPAVMDLIPTSYQAEPRFSKAVAGYIGRRSVLAPARRRELASLVVEPLWDRWQIAESADPDLVLCALYKRSYT